MLLRKEFLHVAGDVLKNAPFLLSLGNAFAAAATDNFVGSAIQVTAVLTIAGITAYQSASGQKTDVLNSKAAFLTLGGLNIATAAYGLATGDLSHSANLSEMLTDIKMRSDLLINAALMSWGVGNIFSAYGSKKNMLAYGVADASVMFSNPATFHVAPLALTCAGLAKSVSEQTGWFRSLAQHEGDATKKNWVWHMTPGRLYAASYVTNGALAVGYGGVSGDFIGAACYFAGSSLWAAGTLLFDPRQNADLIGRFAPK